MAQPCVTKVQKNRQQRNLRCSDKFTCNGVSLHDRHISPSNMCTLASALSRIASIKIAGRNLDKTILTLGPISLSDIILEKSSADLSRTVGFVPLQNKSNRYIRPPKNGEEKFIANNLNVNFFRTIFRDVFNSVAAAA